jgi:tRNA dimethylallyltransferase
MPPHQLTTPPPHHPVPVILGPTASGKTRLAVRLAHLTRGEVISADSRQVYRGMDIGTGKDLADYLAEGSAVPYHLIDIADPGYEYNVYEYQQDFHRAYDDITGRGKLPILCGGSGMYLESVIRGYKLPDLPEDPGFLSELESRSDEELLALYHAICKPHNSTDTVERKRVVKAIRIAVQRSRETEHAATFPAIRFAVFGIRTERELLRKRITDRLHERFEQGMVAEVERLLANGLTPAALKRFGLEYKFVVMYLTGKLRYDEMVRLLNTAIHQFAKRQMTWFRRMERTGITIKWIPERMELDEKIQMVLAEP